MSRKQELLALIEAALKDNATDDQALAFMGKVKRDDHEDVQQAAHALIHFFDDEDIRMKDEVYARSQREELRRWAQALADAEQSDR